MARALLIVGHGQPSAPARGEVDMAALAEAVGAFLPGWRVVGATLADRSSVARALVASSDPLVLPFFIAAGWFTRKALPARLAEAGLTAPRLLPPFGAMAGLPALAQAALSAALGARGWQAGRTDLLFAAHGSARGRAAAEAALVLAEAIASDAGFRAVRVGFIEETPFVADAARGLGPEALCLPLFVARWGHVESDVPAALDAAGFAGALLPPIGQLAGVPRLIADAVRRGSP